MSSSTCRSLDSDRYIWGKFGRNVGPNLADAGLTLARTRGRRPSKSAEVGTHSAKLGRFRAETDRSPANTADYRGTRRRTGSSAALRCARSCRHN